MSYLIHPDVWRALRTLSACRHHLDLTNCILVIDFDAGSAMAFGPETFRVMP